MNPEFRRQLSLELSPARLVLMPAILLMLAICVFVIEGKEPLVYIHKGALTLAALLAACVGTFTALSSINDELSERTWDQQRMSAMGPWRMAWGKLLGGPSYAWYGALLCAAAALLCGFWLGETADTLLALFLTIVGAAALHSAMMASRLYSMDPNKPATSRSIWVLVVLVFLLLQLVSGLVVGLGDLMGGEHGGAWWGLPLNSATLLLLFAVASLLLGLLALWRAMSMQLSVPTTPWAWALGNAAGCLLLVGLVPSGTGRALTGMLLLALVTYYAAALESQVAQRWRALLYSAQHGQWRRFWQNMPLWPISWCMAFAVLLPAYLLWNADPLSNRSQLGPLAFMVLLHVLRDCGIYLVFSLRKSSRSPLGMTLLVVFVLSALLPAMFWSLGLAPLFEPLFGAFDPRLSSNFQHAPALGWLAWSGMLVQLAVLAVALVWRLKAITPRSAAKDDIFAL